MVWRVWVLEFCRKKVGKRVFGAKAGVLQIGIGADANMPVLGVDGLCNSRAIMHFVRRFCLAKVAEVGFRLSKSCATRSYVVRVIIAA